MAIRKQKSGQEGTWKDFRNLRKKGLVLVQRPHRLTAILQKALACQGAYRKVTLFPRFRLSFE